MKLPESVARVIQRVRSPGFVHDVVAVSSGSAGSQAIAILTSPLLMRVYSPGELGVQAICISFLVLGVVASLRFNQAIPLPAKHEKAVNLGILSLGVLTVMTVLFIGAIALSGPQVSQLAKSPEIADYLWILPLLFVLGGTSEILQSVALRFGLFASLGKAQVAQSATQVVYQLGAGIFEPTAKHLLLGVLIGNLAAIAVYIISVRRASQTGFRATLQTVNLRRIWASAVEFRKFPLLAAPSQLVNAVSLQITPLLLAAFYSTTVVGWLALATRVVGLPITTIGYGVSQVFFQRSAKIQNQSPSELLALYQVTARRMLQICLVPITVIAFLGPTLFSIVFGDQWVESGKYVAILAPMFICQFVVSPLSQIMAVIHAQRVQLIWDISRLVIIAASILIVGQMGLEPIYCIGIYGLSMGASYLWLYYLTLRELRSNAAETRA